MFVIDYFLSTPQKDNLLLEFGGLPGGAGAPQRQYPGSPMGGGQQPPPPEGPGTGLVEFEDIKKYVLFGKLKEIRLKLELSNIDKNKPEVLNLFEFLNIVIMFYNTFTYEQAKKHIDVLLELSSSVMKVKIPKREDVEPALDPNKVQAIQIQQQQQLINQQQEKDKQEEKDVENVISQKDKEIDHHKKEAHLAKKEAHLAKKGAFLAKTSLQRKNVAEV